MKKILFLALLMTSNCSSYIIGNNIKLDKLPEEVSVKKLDMYIYAYSEANNDAYYSYMMENDYNKRSGFKFLYYRNDLTQSAPSVVLREKRNLLPESGCALDIVRRYSEEPFDEKSKMGRFYAALSGATLLIIPYYYPTKNYLYAKLIDAKTGNILKEYNLEETEHYFVSLFNLPLSFFFPGKRFSGFQENGALVEMDHKLYSALFRSVTNDAHQFKECRKK